MNEQYNADNCMIFEHTYEQMSSHSADVDCRVTSVWVMLRFTLSVFILC